MLEQHEIDKADGLDKAADFYEDNFEATDDESAEWVRPKPPST